MIAVVIIALYIFSQYDQERYKKDGKDYGANFDCGDDYYWDTNDHEVKKKAW